MTIGNQGQGTPSLVLRMVQADGSRLGHRHPRTCENGVNGVQLLMAELLVTDHLKTPSGDRRHP